MRARSWLSAFVYIGCTTQPGAHGGNAPTSAPEPAARPPAPVLSASSAPQAETRVATAPPSAQPSAPPAPAAALPYAFTKMHDGPATSLAVATATKLGVLIGTQALIFNGREWSALPPIPNADHAHVELFFGRDFEPRLMGSLDDASGSPRSYYKRFKAKRWQDEPSELGPFASGTTPMYGVLGLIDPEVVCRPGAICLIKRISGWTRVPAHPSPVRVILGGGTAWALYPGHLERLEQNGFASFGPAHPWGEPSSVWLDASGAPWIVDRAEPAERALVRFENGGWHSTPSPLREPRAIWGLTSDDVWLVGEDGAAHFDGRAWQRVDGLPGGLNLIADVGGEIWVAGTAGVFRGVRRTASR